MQMSHACGVGFVMGWWYEGATVWGVGETLVQRASLINAQETMDEIESHRFNTFNTATCKNIKASIGNVMLNHGAIIRESSYE